MVGRLTALAVAMTLIAGACSGGPEGSDDVETSDSPTSSTVGEVSTTAGPSDSTTSAPPEATTSAPPSEATGGVLGQYPERVYVPNTLSNTVDVVDPATCTVEKTLQVGQVPHHITPSWDLSELYVYNTQANFLSVIDPATSDVVGEVPIEDPYNMYFTPDGSETIVVAERFRRLDFLDRETWEPIASVTIEHPGIDHLAFSRDGSYLVGSSEFSGWISKVDIGSHSVVGELSVGGLPIDVVRDPHEDNVMYVANQGLHGVHVIDADAMTEIGFIPTGTGAHGILLSKDMTRIYVSNRLEGTISVIDLETREPVAKWNTGGSPDMGILNPDGSRMWIANRYHGSVMEIDTATGEVTCQLTTGGGPHGVTYFPNEGVHSIGHNGLMIDADGANT